MIYIYNQNTFSEYTKELEKFRLLYEDGFPDPNEREVFNTILERVYKEPENDNPYTFIILTTVENSVGSSVTGGIIADWYKGSSAIHLTYIIVSPESRGNKVSNALLFNGIPEIKKIIRQGHGIELKHIFFESNIPWKTKIDSFNAETRLLIFHKLGGKWIDIPYVQPPLDTSKQRVDNLFLLVFPVDSADNKKVKSEEVKEFLKNLYTGLGIKIPEKNSDFQIMMKSLDNISDEEGVILLKKIPGEFPKYKFFKASITFHLIEDPEQYPELPQKRDKPNFSILNETNCSRFYSYEKDLMNFQSQISPPFATVLKSEGRKNKITIVLPKYYSYTSEGETSTVFTNRPEVNANIAISSTLFYNSGIRIWHLTLTPQDSKNWFTEFDLIKLAGNFGSSQEHTEIKKLIRFKTDDQNEGVVLEKLISHYGFVNPEETLISSNTGIIQVDSEKLKYNDNTSVKGINDFYSYFSASYGVNSVPFEDKYDGDEAFKDLMNTFCGLTLGIFDFLRMDSQEVLDTLRPINIFSDSLMIIARGNLMSISADDEIMDDVLPVIGVSPYLLMPSSFLAYNEYVVSSVKKKTDSILDVLVRNNNISISALEEILRDLKDKLNNKYLMSPFQYPTETNIIIEGNRQRGMEPLVLYVKSRIEELSTQIEQKTNFRATVINSAMSSFLLLISLLQVYSLLESWFGNKNMFRLVFILLSAFLTIGSFFLFLGKNKWMDNFLRNVFRLKRKKY